MRFIYIIMCKFWLLPDLTWCKSIIHLFCLFLKKKLEKVLVVRKKAVPLHPLNEKRPSDTPREALRRGVLWNAYIDRRSSTRSSVPIHYLYMQGRWVEETNRSIHWRQWCLLEPFLYPSFAQIQTGRALRFSRMVPGDTFLQWRVWSWLRMNASYRLNTCKSWGSMNLAC